MRLRTLYYIGKYIYITNTSSHQGEIFDNVIIIKSLGQIRVHSPTHLYL